MVPAVTGLDPMVAALNPQQRAAVLHRGGPLLVLAGAGSGKTRVITVRVAQLIATGTAPEHVLALTFTNKAAGEMGERVAHLVGYDAAQLVTVSTFHALGLRMLEEDKRRLGLGRQLTLLDAADQASAVRRCLKQLRIDPRRHDPRGFLMAISNARNAGKTPVDLARSPATRLIGRVYAAYLEYLKAYKAIDFDDLILKPIEMLREHDDLRAKWRDRFRNVLVDEYQDTNGMQLELLRLLIDEHRQLCVVGDDDQAIYGWRGAKVANILDFERHFADATAIALTQNYRSTGHILNAANAVIAGNTARKVKSLWTDVGDGELVRVVRCKDERGESSFVAGEIVKRRNAEGRRWSDFGVLFRASALAQPLEDALRLSGVPYKLVGAFDFFERKEVKDVLSYLRLIANPRDVPSLMRIINFPQRGIGPKSVEALLSYAEEHRMTPWRALTKGHDIPGIRAGQADALQKLSDLVLEATRRYEADGSLAGTVEYICAETKAREAWIRDPTEGPGGQGRWRTIERLLASMRGFQERRPETGVRDYLRLVSLDKASAGDGAEEEDKVALMTLHAAKGLEWPVCFMIGCVEGVIPHQRTLEDSKGDVSEERRLFYVGITRARRHAYVTYASTRRRYRGSEPARPSRFIKDIPKEHRENIDRSKGGGPVTRTETKARFAALKARLGES